MPLVRRVAERALTTRPSAFVVVTGAHDEAVRAALTGLPLHRVCNRDWQEGLASSLRCGAAALKDHIGSVLILGCDQIRLRRVSSNGPPDCTANPDTGFTFVQFSCLIGTSTQCTRVRAILQRTGSDPLPGGQLYNCTYSVDPGVGVSTHVLSILSVLIEDNVFVGHNVSFINDKYPRATNAEGLLQTEADWRVEPTRVREGASIGTSCTILSNVTIGRNAIVGAGSVVTRDIPDDAVAAGNPCRVLRTLKRG